MRFFHKLATVSFFTYFILIFLLISIIGYVSTSSIRKDTDNKIAKIKKKHSQLNRYGLVKQTNIVAKILENRCKYVHNEILKLIMKNLEILIKQNNFSKLPKKIKFSDHELYLSNAFIIDRDFKIIKSYYPITEKSFREFLKSKNIKIEDLDTNYYFIYKNREYITKFYKKGSLYYFLQYYSTHNIIETIKEISGLILDENVSKRNLIFVADKRKNVLYEPIIFGELQKSLIDSTFNVLQKTLGNFPKENFYKNSIDDSLKLFIYKRDIEFPPVTLYSCYIENSNVLNNEISKIIHAKKVALCKFHLVLTLSFLLFLYFTIIATKRFNKTKSILIKFFKDAINLDKTIDINSLHYEEFREMAILINEMIMKIKKTHAQLIERDNYLKSIEEGLGILFSESKPQVAINRFFKILAQKLSLSYIMVLRMEDDEIPNIKYLWSENEKELLRFYNKMPKDILFKVKPELMEKKEKYIFYNSDNNVFAHSQIIFPLYVENKFWGIFIAGNKKNKWSDALTSTLLSFVNSLTLYIIKIQKEEDIEENEKFLELLFNNLKSSVYLINNEGYFAFANKSIESLTGYSVEEMRNMKFYSVVAPEFRSMVKERGERRLNNENVIQDYEFQIITKKGKRKWIEISNTYIELMGKKYILGTAYDVTEKHKSMLVEKVINKITKAVLTADNLSDYIEEILKYLSDIIDMSNSCFLIHNKKNNNINILKYSDEYDSFANASKLNPKSLTAYMFRTKKSMLLYKEDIKQLHKEGKIDIIGTIPEIWMGIWFDINKETNAVIIIQHYSDREKYSNSDLELMEIVIQHITIAINKLEREQKLLDSERKYRTLFESANDAIFLIDELYFIDCNIQATRLLKCAKKDIIGNKWLNFSAEKQNINNQEVEEFVKQKIEKALKGIPQIFEWKIKDKSNGIIQCEISLNIIQLKEKSYIIAIVRDISERMNFISELKSNLKVMKFQNEEIFHRVMNNLQIYKSLFKIYRLKGNYSEETKVLLNFLMMKTQLISTILSDIYYHTDKDYLDLEKSFRKVILDWITLHKGQKVNILSQIHIPSKIKYILGAMIVLDLILSLVNRKIKNEKSNLKVMKFQNEEIFHRVMNNLQIYKSLFKIYRLKGNYSEETKVLLNFLMMKTQLISTILSDIYYHTDKNYLDLEKSFRKVILDWITLHKGQKVNILSQIHIPSKIKYILGAMIVLDLMLSLVNRKIKNEKSNSALNIRLEKKDDYFAKIVITENGKKTIKNLSELNITIEENLMLSLFLSHIEGKIVFERSNKENYYILVFRYFR